MDIFMPRAPSVRTVPLLLLLGTGCGGPKAPPTAGEARGAIPDLRGRTVMVLPPQSLAGVSSAVNPDAELVYALSSRGEEVLWVFPEEMEAILRRSPSVQARIRNLPVGFFLQAEVERIGDPLYGELRRLAALTGAEIALLPVELRYGDGAYRIAAALLDPRTGRVYWYGIIAGNPGPPEDPGALASTTDSLAQALLPWR